jgi:hypothetical protein
LKEEKEMTVNKSCFVKSLKKDYSVLAYIIGAIIIISLMLFIIISNYDTIITGASSLSRPFTAYNIYIAGVPIIMGFFLLVIATDTATPKEYKPETGYLLGSWLIIGIIPILVMIAYYCYAIATTTPTSFMWRPSPITYPSIFTEMAIFIIIALLATPVAVAYSRCKA